MPNSLTKINLDRWWKFLLLLFLFFYGAILTKDILIPIVFSFFIAILLNPLVVKMEKWRVPQVIAIILALLLVVLVLSSGVYYTSFQAKNLINDMPDLLNKLNSFVLKLDGWINRLTGLDSLEQMGFLKDNTDKIISSGTVLFKGAVSTTTSFLSFITLVPIYVFFILLSRKNFKIFLVQLGKKNETNYFTIAKEITEMAQNYISGLLLVIAIIAILNISGLLILGIKYAIFLGILSALLTIIPYIGIVLGSILPILVALLTKDSLLYVVGVIAVFGLVQFLEGNFITLKIIGSKVNVNPLSAIIALIIGGAAWGISGMILAIPILGIIQIILSSNQDLKPFSALISNS